MVVIQNQRPNRMSSSDLSTFNGRFLHFLKVTDPRTLLYSKQDVLDAKCAVDVFKDKGIACGEPSDMPHYQRLVNSAIHPVTNEIIPRLFRVSAIAPVNIPLVFAMLSCPASNIPGTLFLHWLNQSYNTACNYYNRSGAEQSLEQTVKAYTLAVSSACTFAYGLGKLVDRYPTTLKRFGVIIPCVATAVASCSNLCFTRYDEMENGVLMIDQEQKVILPSYIHKLAPLQYISYLGTWTFQDCWSSSCNADCSQQMCFSTLCMSAVATCCDDNTTSFTVVAQFENSYNGDRVKYYIHLLASSYARSPRNFPPGF